MKRLEAILAIQAPWSDATFGTPDTRGPWGPLKHLQHECDEAMAAPNDVEEFADCLLLLLDANRRAGHSINELLTSAEFKVRKNLERKWGPPDPHGATFHIKDES